MDISVFFTWDNFIILLKGAGMSLGIASISVVCGILLGTLIALCKLSNVKALRVIGNVYVELIRGTPMLLQILFFFQFFSCFLQSLVLGVAQVGRGSRCMKKEHK